MPDPGFHFSSPGWLWLLAAPLAVLLWLRLSAPWQDTERYRAYADEHLLPLLLGITVQPVNRKWRAFAIWTITWVLLVLAIAGPRWDYHDVQVFRPGSDLVILLDLSGSMDVDDVAPSRLGRARQEIEDLIDHNRHTRIGLIGFATLAHIVSPLTEDGNTLRLQLPALSTDLVQLKGSRLADALNRARQMLAGQPADSSRHLLLVSDGDFGDSSWEDSVKQLTREGTHVHVLGVGTLAGGLVPDAKGKPLTLPNGRQVVSRLDEAGLQRVAELGNGIYRQAGYRDDDTRAILDRIAEDATAEQVANQRTRIWHERFYWLVALLMLPLLPGFRRSAREQPEQLP